MGRPKKIRENGETDEMPVEDELEATSGVVFKVLTDIFHNGKSFSPGDEIGELTEPQIEQLLAVAAIEVSN